MNLKLLLDQLYTEIAHGDDEHRLWLRKKLDDFCIKNNLTEAQLEFCELHNIPVNVLHYLLVSHNDFEKVYGKITRISEYGNSIFLIYENNKCVKIEASVYEQPKITHG